MAERQPFDCVPRWLRRDPDRRVSPRAHLVFMELVAHVDLPDGARPSQQHIADTLGCNRDTVRLALNELEAAGVIYRERRYGERGRLPNRYRVVEDCIYRTGDVPRESGTPQRGLPRESGTPQRGLPRESGTPAGGVPYASGIPLPKKSGRKENEGRENESPPTLPGVADADAGSDRSAEPDADRGFDAFWEAYPRRNGRRVGKKQAREKWRKLSYADKRNAWRAAVAYNAAVQAGQTIAKDPARFLAADFWRDWLDEPVDEPRPDRPGVDPKRYAERMTEPGPVPGTKRGIL